MLIGASGGFDHYRTGSGLVILGLPQAVKLRGEMPVVKSEAPSLGWLPVPHSRRQRVSLV